MVMATPFITTVVISSITPNKFVIRIGKIMPKGLRKKRSTPKGSIFVALSFISFLTLLTGMGLLLVKSPDKKAELYASLISQYQTKLETELLSFDLQEQLQQQTYALSLQALKANPKNAQSWKVLAQQLAQMNQIDKAMKARDIAITLGAQHVPPVMAMRSLMPERNLALSDTLVSATIQR